MSDADPSTAPEPSSVSTLDPFAFWPASASGIPGLGGLRPDPDPAYVFHSLYVAVEPGLVQCSVRFTDLAATYGTLAVRINALSTVPNARADSAKVWTIQLRDVADAGGEITTSFTAAPDTTYAVLGHMYTQSDARAQALEIILETRPTDSSIIAKSATAHKSDFGRKMFRLANRMATEGRATLIDPVSQACTETQFDEPDYAEWLAKMRATPRRDRTQWAQVYVLQTLKRYRMLVGGARGLGFGVGPEPLPTIMQSFGCSILATEHIRTRSPGTGAAGGYRVVDPATIDADLTDFDFTWSIGTMERLGSIATGLDFVRNSIDCLNYGGLAVHATSFNLTSNADTVDDAGEVLFRKQDIEKIALDLVSRGHFVAQIKYDFGAAWGRHADRSTAGHHEPFADRYIATSFGLIVRRGDR